MKKKKLFFLTSLLAFASVVEAQSLYFPFDGSAIEQQSAKTFNIEGVRTLPYMPGAKGQALRLDGYSNYIKATGLDYSKISSTAMSFSLWMAVEGYPMMNVNEAETTPTYTLIAGNFDESAKTGFGIFLNSQGGYQFKCYLKSWLLTCDAKDDVIPTYEWQSIVVTLDKSNNKILLYRNGQQVGTAKCPYDLNVGSAPFYIGKSSTTLMSGVFNINTFNGLIDEVKVENKVLSLDEIAALKADNEADLTVPASAWQDDMLRPHFHGMPSHAWTNECHGMTFSDGKYHLFFQKNGNGPYMARLNWGHIESEDLLTWNEVPAAIAPSTSYDIKGCWSGCVFTDGQITSGNPYIMYTGVDNAKATINIATPDDASLLNWTKTTNNPIINGRPSGLSDDFRDPYFFRTNEGAFIIVGSSKNNIGTCTLHKYDATSGSWSNNGSLFYTGVSANVCGTFWEMPNVTKMGDKYLFTITPQNTGSGVRTIYYTGSIDASGQFTPGNTTPQTVELSGFAKDGYGMLSPTIYQTADGKTIALGIVPDKLSSQDNYDMGYAHTYSLPREWSLASDGSLIQKPYSGLQGLRTGEGTASGRQVEVVCEFTVGTGNVGTYLLKNGDKSAKVYYNPTLNTLNVDLSTLDRKVNDSGVFNGVYSSTLPRVISKGETMKLDVFLDGSVLDIFVNDQWATSVRVFATDAEATGVEVLADDSSDVISYKNWNLDADSADGIESIFVDAVDTNNPTTGGNVYDLNGRRSNAIHKGVNIVSGKKILVR